MKEIIKPILGLWAFAGCVYIPMWILQGIEKLFDFQFSFDAGVTLCLLLICSFMFILFYFVNKYDNE